MRRSKKRGKAKQNKKLIWLAIAVLVVGIGFAALQKYLNINGSASIDSNFDVRISNITKGEVEGQAYEKEEASYTDTTATFNVGLKNVGDSLTYEVKVSNIGSTNAKLESIDVSEEGSSNITYEVTGISENDIIDHGDDKTIYVKTTYSGNESQASEKTLTVTLLFKQTTDSSETPVVKTYDVGEEITLGTEHFYVIKDNGDSVTALAKYNLYVGNNYIYNADTGEYTKEVLTESTEGYGLQNSLAKGEIRRPKEDKPTVAPRVEGTDVIGAIYYSDASSALASYKNYLNNRYNNTIMYTSFLTIDEAEELGCVEKNEGDIGRSCTESNYEWLYSTDYWIKGLVHDDLNNRTLNRAVTNYGMIIGDVDNDEDHGVRPVITVTKSVLN